jgi:hypothetical protein
MTDKIEQAFEAGRLAALEGVTDCPHYATSDCANAWHVGRAYETCRPSVYGPSKVRTMSGNCIGISEGIGFPATASRNPHIVVYRVAWQAGMATVSRSQ